MALFGGQSTAAAGTTNTAQGDLSKDVQIKDLPEDSVSQIAFSPQAEFLAASSWDKKVRIWEIDGQGNSQGKVFFEHEGPVLSCAWSKDGTKVVGGGADKYARMLDLQATNSTPQIVAMHDQPIRCVQMIEVNGSPMLITGSWDRTVKYWDLRAQQPAATLQCQERIYAMDSRNQLLVIATADRYVNIVNLNDPGKFYKTMQSPLKWQTRTVACFTDASGFAIGSIEGRCAIQYVEEKDHSLNFSFRCHRQSPPGNRDVSNVYSVNCINFHPVHGTFSTAGSDGTFHFWDKDAKHRLKGYPEVGQTIISTAFNRSGTIFAYAASYDWSKGYAHHTPQGINKIMLHPILGDECKPRQNSKKR